VDYVQTLVVHVPQTARFHGLSGGWVYGCKSRTRRVVMSFFDQLSRRNVIWVAHLYVAVSWVILQMADLMFDAFALPEWSMRLAVVFLALGFPVALVISWVFEITADGIRRESADVQQRADTRRLKVAIFAFVPIALATVACDRVVPESPEAPANQSAVQAATPGRSIAVLPFINISDDPANVYFSDGLAEELLNLLSNIDELRVTARTSSFSFRDADTDILTIGRTLNVANALEGSVRKAGNRIRITVKLISTDDGIDLWSDANAVVDALRMSLLGDIPSIRETDPEAYTAYLRALHFYRQRTPDGYFRAIEQLEQAIDIDGRYAPAWSLLSATYSDMALIGALSFSESHEKALRAVETALEIDPDYPFANSSRAWMAMTSESDFDQAAKFFKRALSLSPGNATIIGNAAVFARTLGHVDRAIAMTEESLSLDPVSTNGYINLSDQLYRIGRNRDAAIAARKALKLTPGNDTARANMALAHLLAEQPQQAIEDITSADREFLKALVYSLAYASLGETLAADVNLDTMIENYADSSAFYIASIYAWRGEVDHAFDWLYLALEEQQAMLGVRTDPFLQNLHDDPRWAPLLEEVGLSDAQVAAIDF
jgi:TolB-like protein/Tfp pilus assembly protein PilF